MLHETTIFKNSSLSKIFFVLSIIVFAFWIVGQIIDVYRFTAIGAIYEVLWLFMLLMLFVLPIISLILLIIEKFNPRSLYLYTIIIAVTNILLMILLR
jgi:hypothetical protein